MTELGGVRYLDLTTPSIEDLTSLKPVSIPAVDGVDPYTSSRQEDFVGFVKGLLGGKADTVKEIPSNPPSFPTEKDVEFARKYDFSYGQTWAPYFENKVVTLPRIPPNDNLAGLTMGLKTLQTDKLKGFTYYGSGPPHRLTEEEARNLRDEVYNYHARTALAIGTSALATLGYNPGKMAIDPRNLGKTNLAGFSDPITKETWVNPYYLTTGMHESIHAGVNRLKDTVKDYGNKYWKPEFDVFSSDKNSLNSELLVRQIMRVLAGADESNKELVNKAEKLFKSNPKLSQTLNDLEKAAAQYLADKHPMGPR